MSSDGFDAAVIGVTTNKATSELVLVYSRSLALMVLMLNMPYEEAIEYFDFNVEGAYMGDKTPIWVDDEMFTDMMEE